jgi:hypothetical protein
VQIKIKEGIIKENILFIFLAALLMAAAVLQLTNRLPNSSVLSIRRKQYINYFLYFYHYHSKPS